MKETKSCPFCQEEIHKAAIICKFCHLDTTAKYTYCQHCAELIKCDARLCRYCLQPTQPAPYDPAGAGALSVKKPTLDPLMMPIPPITRSDAGAAQAGRKKPSASGYGAGSGDYGSGVRAQVFEVIVRQAIAGAPWREICAGPMEVNNISVEEIEAEVRRRRRGFNS